MPKVQWGADEVEDGRVDYFRLKDAENVFSWSPLFLSFLFSVFFLSFLAFVSFFVSLLFFPFLSPSVFFLISLSRSLSTCVLLLVR